MGRKTQTTSTGPDRDRKRRRSYPHLSGSFKHVESHISASRTFVTNRQLGGYISMDELTLLSETFAKAQDKFPGLPPALSLDEAAQAVKDWEPPVNVGSVPPRHTVYVWRYNIATTMSKSSLGTALA